MTDKSNPALRACADALAPSEDVAMREELRMGHVRIDECAGTEHTNGQPLYGRISFVLQRAEERRAEEEHLRKAVSAETDVLRARANAAEHRQAAAEYRAQRIVLDQELLARAEKAEAEVARLRADALAPPEPRALQRLQDTLKAVADLVLVWRDNAADLRHRCHEADRKSLDCERERCLASAATCSEHALRVEAILSATLPAPPRADAREAPRAEKAEDENTETRGGSQ